MAALDFPATPTNGQVYTQDGSSWTYDSTKAAWRSSPYEPGAAIISATAPTNPQNGDIWFNTNDGTMYVYYNDGNTSQWVESRAPITANGYYSPNYIINGGFDIWQRGTSFAAPTTVYSANTADRWNSFRGGFATGFTVSRQSAGLTGFQYCARVQRDSGNTSTAQITFNQTLESVNSIPLAGKTVTLSFYARAGANYSASGGSFTIGVSSGTGTDQNIQSGFTGNAVVLTASATLTTSWQRFTATGTVSSSATQLGLASSFIPVGTAGAADYVEITGVQLEEGSIATPFRRNANSIQGELAACQRYYVRWSGSSTIGSNPGLGAWTTDTTTQITLFMPVEMRIRPTALERGGNIYPTRPGISGYTLSAAVLSRGDTKTQLIIVTSSGSGASIGSVAQLELSNSDTSYIALSAEL